MPRTLTTLQSRYASLTHWKPGSPESQEAGRDFWCAKAIQDLQDCLARSPLPFTDEQRQRITELLAVR
jgi:hypothetical protein